MHLLPPGKARLNDLTGSLSSEFSYGSREAPSSFGEQTTARKVGLTVVLGHLGGSGKVCRGHLTQHCHLQMRNPRPQEVVCSPAAS